MAKYQITSPDGQAFEVSAPDAATQDEVLNYAQQNWGKTTSEPSAAPPLRQVGELPQQTVGMEGLPVVSGGMPAPETGVFPAEVQQRQSQLGEFAKRNLAVGAATAVPYLKQFLYNSQLAGIQRQADEIEWHAQNNPGTDFSAERRSLEAVRARVETEYQQNKAPIDIANEFVAEARPQDATIVDDAIGSFAQTLPTLAAGLATGTVAGPLAGLAVGAGGGGAVQAGQTAGEARDKGADPTLAMGAGLANGMLEGVGEYLGIGKIFKSAKGGLLKIASALGYEATQEGVTQLLQDINSKAAYDPNLSPEEMGRNAAVAFLAGAMGGGFGVAHQKTVEVGHTVVTDAIDSFRTNPVEAALGGQLADAEGILGRLKSKKEELEQQLTDYGAAYDPAIMRDSETEQKLESAKDLLYSGSAPEDMNQSQDPKIREIASLYPASKENRSKALTQYVDDLYAQMYNGLPGKLDESLSGRSVLEAITQAGMSTHFTINEGTGVTQQGENVDGQTFFAGGHGSTLVMAADPKNSFEMGYLAKTLDKWVAKFMPDMKILLTDQLPDLKPWNPQNHAATFWILNRKDSVGISVNPLALKNQQMPLFLAHELGHRVIDRMFSDSPEGVKKALMRAWKEELAAAVKSNMTASEYEQMVGGGVQSGINFFGTKAGSRPLGSLLSNSNSMSDFVRYYANFSEWTAHQFERAFVGDFKGMRTEVKEFIKKSFEALKGLYSTLAKPVAPNMTFKQFVEYHLTYQAVNRAQKRVDELKGSLDKEVWRQPTMDAALATLNGDQLKDLVIIGDELRSPLSTGGSNPLNRKIASVFNYYFKRNKDTSDFRGDLDKFSKFKQITASLLFIAQQNRHIRQLYDPLGTVDPQTGKINYGYVNLVESWHNDKMKRMANANDTLKLWRNMTKEDQENLNQFMIDQVLEGKFYNPLDPAVIEAYGLNEKTLGMFNRIKGDFVEVLDSLEKILLDEAQARLILNPTSPQQLDAIRQRFADLRARPYFPLTRFGKYVILVRAGRDIELEGQKYKQGEVIYREHFDSETELAASMDAVKGRWRGHDVKSDEISKSVQSFAAVPREILEAMKSRLDLDEKQREALNQYLLELAPAQSYSKHLMQRRGVLGFSWDLQRSYANYMMQGSNYLARIQYSQQMREVIQQLQATANAITGDSTTRRQIANYMASHYDYIMAPENDWAALRGMVSLAVLGFVVKSAVVNLLQVPMVAFPHLAAIHGDAKAMAALFKAYGDVTKMYHQLRPLDAHEQVVAEKWMAGAPLTAEEEGFIEKWTGLKSDEYSAMNQWLEERAALQEAKSQGFIDESFAMELAGLAHGGMMSKLTASTKSAGFVRQFGQVAMLPFEIAERMNRRVVFMAAYRLAKESGLDEKRAFVQAKEAVRTTQFEYAKYNRPELMRGKKGILFMFMQYQLSMLYFLGGGDKGWWRALTLLLLAVGPMGLPFMKNITDVIEAVLAKIHPNEKTDIERELKELIGQIVDNPDIFLHGASRYGFGLLPWADLSGSISMGRIIPGTDVVKHLSEGQNFNAAVRDSVSEAGGATSTLVMRMMQAAASDDPDTWRRVERGMPFTAGQQVMTALRWYNRGGETNSKGTMIKSLDPNDPYEAAEIAGKALGFNPREVSAEKESQRLRQDFLNFYLIRRQLLLNSLNFAIQQSDMSARENALGAIRTYNQEVPFKSMSIKGAEIRNSIKQHAKAQAMEEAIGLPTKRGMEIGQEVR